MKIEKKRFTATTKWTSASVKGMAALLGLATAATLSACEDDGSSNPAGPSDPTPASSSAPVQPASSADIPSSSSSDQVIVDIPLSSTPVEPIPLAGDPIAYPESSSESSVSSNAINFNDCVIDEARNALLCTELVQNDGPASSSSDEKCESCDSIPVDPSKCILVSGEAGFQKSNVYLCPIPSATTDETIFVNPLRPSELIVSMVTTFESTDIDV